VDTGKTILIVEDEGDLLDVLYYHLEREGYKCRRARDGEAALAEVQRSKPDLVVLDRMLPKLSGDEVATQLKRDSRTADLPIIMLTAKAEDSDELVGFALGADDYIRKPFSMKLLLARISAVLRRDFSSRQEREVLTRGPVTLDRGRHEVTVDGQAVALTATEFRILATLMAAGGRVLDRGQLIDAVLGRNVAVTDRTIDVHIAALRKKLGTASRCIQTVRGVGYTFRVPVGETSQG
jgi:two-component system phosphate regulon response regulator PhoB